MNLYKTLEDKLKETLTPRGDTVCLDPPVDEQVRSLKLSTEFRLSMSEACLLSACTHLRTVCTSRQLWNDGEGFLGQNA
jgi:hypothetical protein